MLTYKELKANHSNSTDRLAYIDFMLRFTGVVRRSDIGEMFNLSDAAASKILAEYSSFCEKNIEYNRSVRANAIVRQHYEPMIELDADTALGMLAHGFNKNRLSRTQTTIPFEKIGRDPNNLAVESVAKITRAINGKYAISCKYHSENSNDHNTRIIIPLAIMHDGENWMFRGYHRDDPKNIFFKNFHFSRAMNVVEYFEEKEYKALPHETLESDKEWNLILPLQLKIHSDRDESEKRRIRIDFGISEEKDILTIQVRSAFLWIMEREWYIDSRKDEEKSKAQEQKYFKFELLNAEMIELIKTSNFK